MDNCSQTDEGQSVITTQSGLAVINSQLDKELQNALEQGKNEIQLLELQHEHLIKKQECLKEQLRINAGDLLCSKIICDQLIEHKNFIMNVLNKNLADLMVFEKDEELIVTTFELEPPKMKLFLDI